jgi:hypothetical protein
MNQPSKNKKTTPRLVQRYLLPAIFILLLLGMAVVFAVTFLSMAGLTPGI